MASSKITTIDLEEPVVEALNTIDTVADQITEMNGEVDSIKTTVEGNSNKLDTISSGLTDIKSVISSGGSSVSEVVGVAASNTVVKTITGPGSFYAGENSITTNCRVVNCKGYMRIIFNMNSASSSNTSTGYVYINDKQLYSCTTKSTSYVDVYVDVYVNDGDILSFGAGNSGIGGGQGGCSAVKIGYVVNNSVNITSGVV